MEEPFQPSSFAGSISRGHVVPIKSRSMARHFLDVDTKEDRSQRVRLITMLL